MGRRTDKVYREEDEGKRVVLSGFMQDEEWAKKEQALQKIRGE